MSAGFDGPLDAGGVALLLGQQWVASNDMGMLRAAVRAAEQGVGTGEVRLETVLSALDAWQQHANKTSNAEAAGILSGLRSRLGGASGAAVPAAPVSPEAGATGVPASQVAAAPPLTVDDLFPAPPPGEPEQPVAPASASRDALAEIPEGPEDFPDIPEGVLDREGLDFLLEAELPQPAAVAADPDSSAAAEPISPVDIELPPGVLTPSPLDSSSAAGKQTGADRVSSAKLPLDPATLASRNLEKWFAADDVEAIMNNYSLLPLSNQRKRVLDWAVSKAWASDLRPLIEIAGGEQDPTLSAHLGKLLEGVPADLLVPKLSGTAYNPRQRLSVAVILGRCKAPEAGRMLVGLADDEHHWVRENALRALAVYPFQDDLQIPVFKYRLENDDHRNVRLEAARGLLQIGTPAALNALHEALKTGPPSREIENLLAQYSAKLRAAAAPAEETVVAKPKRKFRWKDLLRALPVAKVVFYCVALAVIVWGVGDIIGKIRQRTQLQEVARPKPPKGLRGVKLNRPGKVPPPSAPLKK